MRERYTLKQVEAALRATGGVLMAAGQKLGCTRQSVQGYLKRHPELEIVRKEAIEATLDLAESQLIKAIAEGNMTAVIFTLKTLGHRRGYQERRQISFAKPIDEMTEDELVAFTGGEPDDGELAQAVALARADTAGTA